MSRVVVEKKYHLGEEREFTRDDGSTIILRRIVADKNFAGVNVGDIGGWIENESNLSQIDNCWIYDDAIVCGNSRVEQKAAVHDNVYIDGKSIIGGRATITDFANLFNTNAYGNCTISNFANITNADIYDNAEIVENGFVEGYNNDHHIRIFGDSMIRDFASIKGNDICIHDNVIVCGFAKIGSYVDILDDTTINDFVYINGYSRSKMIRIYGDTVISGNIFINGYGDILDVGKLEGMMKFTGKIKINCDMEYNSYDKITDGRISQYMPEDDD